MKLPEGKSRLELVKAGVDSGVAKRGRLVVGLDKLVEDPKNERKTFRNMDGLIASIKGVGMVEPITVTDQNNGTFQIVTGHRRFRAAKAAGLDSVEVLIREPVSERERRIKSVVSNVQHEDIGPVEMAEALQSLLDEDDQVKSQRELAKLIGKQESWVSQILGVLHLPIELRQKLETSKVSVPYDGVAKIARLKDVESQRHLIEALLDGASNADIREQITKLKGGRGSTTKPKMVYRTEHHATVIVQSTQTRLSQEQTIAALDDALRQARESSSKR
jgi:ParB family chromosome partitioning protein